MIGKAAELAVISPAYCNKQAWGDAEHPVVLYDYQSSREERAVRPFAVGRKNLFSDTPKGAGASAAA